MTIKPRRLRWTLACLAAAAPLAAAPPSQPATTQSADAQTYRRQAERLHDANRAAPDRWPDERAAWQHAIDLAPDDLTFRRGLLHLEIDTIRFAPTAAAMTSLRAAATQLIARQPSDVEATAWLHVSYLMAYIGGAPEDRAALEHLSELTGLIAKHPEQSGPALYAVAALVRQANGLRTPNGDVEPAIKKIDECVALFDGCLAAAPTDPVVILRAYDVLRSADAEWRILTNPAPGVESAYRKRIAPMLEVAKAHVAPTSPVFSEVYTTLASVLLGRNDVAAAERLAREGLALRPDDQELRLLLASLVHNDPAKRKEAIALMQRPVTDVGGPGATLMHRRDAMTLLTELELVNDLTADYTAATDAAARKAVMAQIDDALVGLERAAQPNDPVVMKAKARVALTRGDAAGAVKAVADLEKARDALHRAAGVNAAAATDWELEQLLGYAYLNSNQTGLAKAQFWRVIDARPALIPPRVALARILIAEHDADLAREQVDVIRKLSPNDPDLPRLRTSLALSQFSAADPKRAAEVFEQLPESTLAEVREKAAVAVAARRFDDAVRLYTVCLKADPADAQAVRTVAQIHAGQNHRDLALKVVDAALAKSPADVSLQILRAQIAQDADKVKALTLEQIERTTDPLARELALFDFYHANADPAAAAQHLDAAEKLGPDDTRVWNLRFGEALTAKRFDEAERYAKKLGAQNVDEANGLIYRYRLDLARPDLDAAESDANAMLQHYPQYSRSWQFLGDVLRYKGQYEQAVGKYASALERQSGAMESIRGIVESLQALRRPLETKRYLDDAARYYPADPWVHEQITVWQQQFGDVDAAIATRKADRDAQPDAFVPAVQYAASYFYAAQRANAATQPATKPTDPAQARHYADEAHAALEEVAAKWPDERLPYALLADLASLTGTFDDGEKWLKAMGSREKWKASNEPDAMLADFYVRSRKPDLAVSTYEAALAKSRLPETYQANATAFLSSRGLFDLALKAVDRKSANPTIQRFVTETLASAGRTEEAVRYVDALIAKHPKDANLLTARGFALQRAGRLGESLAVCDAAIALDPRLADAYYYRGLTRLRQNPANPDAVVEDFARARQLTPPSSGSQFAQFCRALSDVYLRTGEPDRAARELEVALKVSPRDAALRMRLIDLYSTRLAEPRWADVQRLLEEASGMPDLGEDPAWREAEARMWMARNDPEKALAALRVALPQVKRLNDPARTVNTLKEYLTTLYRSGRYFELQTWASNLLKDQAVADSAWWVYEARGLAQAKEGNKAGASDDFDKALSISARVHDDRATGEVARSLLDTFGVDDTLDHLDKLVAGGNAHLRSLAVRVCTVGGDRARAQSRAETLLADLQSGRLPAAEAPSVHDAAAMAYLYAERYDLARDMYEKVLAARPESVEAADNLAVLYAENLTPPDFTRAAAYSDRAMKLLDKNENVAADVLDTRGWVLVLSGKIDEGQQTLQAAAERAKSPLIHYHLARAALLQGRREECRAELVAARRLVQQLGDERKFVDPRLLGKISAALQDLEAQKP